MQDILKALETLTDDELETLTVCQTRQEASLDPYRSVAFGLLKLH